MLTRTGRKTEGPQDPSFVRSLDYLHTTILSLRLYSLANVEPIFSFL